MMKEKNSIIIMMYVVKYEKNDIYIYIYISILPVSHVNSL